MKIGEVARQADVAIDTIRYYERRGLLTATRTPSGYRAFTLASVERIRFAKELQALGFTLDEVGEVLRYVDRGVRKCEGEGGLLTTKREPSSPFDRALARIDKKLAELRETRRRLVSTVRRCREGKCLLVERAPQVAK